MRLGYIIFCLKIMVTAEVLQIEPNEFLGEKMYGGAIMKRSISAAIKYAYSLDPSFEKNGGKMKIVSYHTNFFIPILKQQGSSTSVVCKLFGKGRRTLFIRSRFINESQEVCAETMTILTKVDAQPANALENPLIENVCLQNTLESDSRKSCNLISHSCPFYPKIACKNSFLTFIKPLQSKYNIGYLFNKEDCPTSENQVCFSFEMKGSTDQNNEALLAFLSDIFVVLLASPDKELDKLNFSSIDHSIQFTDYDTSKTNRFVFKGRVSLRNGSTCTVYGKIYSQGMNLVCDVTQVILIHEDRSVPKGKL